VALENDGQTLNATIATAISARRIIFVLANSVAFLRFQIVQALMVCMKLSKRHLLGNVCVAGLKSDKLRRRDREKQLGGAVNTVDCISVQVSLRFNYE
jgi:hypothetical protein